MEIREIIDWLEEQGWKIGRKSEYETFDRVWYKRFPKVEPRCACNESKPGIQLSLKMWNHSNYQRDGYGFELELRAEPDDGVWVQLRSYGLTDSDLVDRMDSQTDKLIRAWQAVQSEEDYTPHGTELCRD